MKRTNNIKGPNSDYDRITCSEEEEDEAIKRGESVRRPGRISHVAIVLDNGNTLKVQPERSWSRRRYQSTGQAGKLFFDS